MNRKLVICLFALVLVVPAKLDAQRWKLQRYEASLGSGITMSFMDIGSAEFGVQALQLKGVRPPIIFGAQYKILEDLSVGLDLSYVMFGGSADGRLPVESFTTHSFEHVAVVHYNLISSGRRKAAGGSSIFNRRGMVNSFNTSSVYVFAAAGGILTKAVGRDIDGNLVQDNPYFYNNAQYGVVFPMGIGLKYSYSAYLSFGLEVGGRFTLSDKLDGYQTPFSNYNDRYIITSVKAIYKIKNDIRGLPTFGRRGGIR
jgi:hypothetical protein